ncbi:hypothetical protein D3C71_448660 [compost metagenome]
MRELLERNSKINRLIFAILVISFFGVVFYEVAYFKSTFVCGKIIGTSKMRGVNFLHYSFSIDERSYFSSIAQYDLKNGITIDSLKKVDCIQIEYSFISVAINRFTDKRFLGE